MKKINLLIIALFLTKISFSQVGSTIQVDSTIDESSIFSMVEEMPVFAGGNDSINIFIMKNLKYPDSAKKDNIKGRVYVGFVVTKIGSIANIKIIKGIREDLNNEAIRLVKMMPNWKPGKQNGRSVNSRFNLPIDFK